MEKRFSYHSLSLFSNVLYLPSMEACVLVEELNVFLWAGDLVFSKVVYTKKERKKNILLIPC